MLVVFNHVQRIDAIGGQYNKNKSNLIKTEINYILLQTHKLQRLLSLLQNLPHIDIYSRIINKLPKRTPKVLISAIFKQLCIKLPFVRCGWVNVTFEFLRIRRFQGDIFFYWKFIPIFDVCFHNSRNSMITQTTLFCHNNNIATTKEQC